LDIPAFEATTEISVQKLFSDTVLNTNQWVSNSCTISLVIDGSMENLYVFDAIAPRYQISDRITKQNL